MEIKITEPDDAPTRISMILWGESGCGKTVLASTFPGRKLWILFDPDGTLAIRHIPNWSMINLTQELPIDIMKASVGINPLGIEALLADYDTVVIDSLTKFTEHALAYAITQVPSNAKFRPTLYAPGMQGYGARNIFVGTFVSNMLRITSKLNKHICIITHEKDGDRNDDGVILSVNMMLGGQLPNVTSKDISEVWHLRDYNKQRHIAIRPERLRSPMKSRMFDMTGDTSFLWKYNANTQTGASVAQWWQSFIEGRYVKLTLPK